MEALKKNWRGELHPQQEHSRERCRKQKQNLAYAEKKMYFGE